MRARRCSFQFFSQTLGNNTHSVEQNEQHKPTLSNAVNWREITLCSILSDASSHWLLRFGVNQWDSSYFRFTHNTLPIRETFSGWIVICLSMPKIQKWGLVLQKNLSYPQIHEHISSRCKQFPHKSEATDRALSREELRGCASGDESCVWVISGKSSIAQISVTDNISGTFKGTQYCAVEMQWKDKTTPEPHQKIDFYILFLCHWWKYHQKRCQISPRLPFAQIRVQTLL